MIFCKDLTVEVLTEDELEAREQHLLLNGDPGGWLDEVPSPVLDAQYEEGCPVFQNLQETRVYAKINWDRHLVFTRNPEGSGFIIKKKPDEWRF
jgi:hypothetical protein